MPADTIAPKINTELESLGRREQQVTQQLTDLSTQDASRAASHEAVLRPQEDVLTQQMSAPMPQRQVMAMPKPPGKLSIDPKEYEGLSYALIGMALVGGAVSHGNWLGVSSALNGALKGFYEGNQQKAKEEYNRYEREFNSAVMMEKQTDHEYQDALNNRKISINEQLQRINITARRNGAEDIAAATKTKNLQTVVNQIEARRAQLLGTEARHTDVAAKVNAQIATAATRGAAAEGLGGGTSQRYETDPKYKASVDHWAFLLNKGIPLPARFPQLVGKRFSNDVFQVAGSSDAGTAAANRIGYSEMLAEARKLGTQTASVSIANKELEKFIPLAEAASDAVPRSSWRPLNTLQQAVQNTLSPAQKRLLIANRSAINAYAQLIQRGAPTVHSLTEAKDLLLTADSSEVYKAGLQQLALEGRNAEQGLDEARGDLLKRASGGASSNNAPAPPAEGLSLEDIAAELARR